MLKMIISASSNPESLILDPFCGSGTTLQAANETKRNWIGIDQSITAIKYSIQRINIGTKKMGDYISNVPTNNTYSSIKHKKFRLLTDVDIYQQFKSDIDQIL